MTKKLKVLFVSVEGIGHVNGCISLGQSLLGAGHEVLFALTDSWRPRIEALGFGFVEIYYDDQPKMDNPAKFFAELLVKTGKISSRPPLDRVCDEDNEFKLLVDITIKLDSKIGPILAEVKPDLIVCDQFCTLPSVETSGIPWVWSWSANPLYMWGQCDDMPPWRLGLPIENGDKSNWRKLREIVNQADYESWKKYNEYFVSKGGKPLKTHIFTEGSPYLNVYGFPEELDYTDIKPLPKHYIRFDNLMRSEVNNNGKKFEIPEKIRDRAGKLIYFSLGSMCSGDVPMMKRLVSILSESKHRFIVSKGPLHDEYELADNMWGESTLPQLDILPVVDLIITHGGNNTVTESFYFGKPMIVMPFFGDQPDNAQRIHEKGFGVRLDPYRCGKEELLNAIETLLNDKELNENMTKISKRIQSTKSINNFPKLVEKLIE